ncbi:hypothetical protein IPH67_01995 [bacterium]|nr:MAG: hypothetical protein IPH67_01995 [bacterium]
MIKRMVLLLLFLTQACFSMERKENAAQLNLNDALQYFEHALHHDALQYFEHALHQNIFDDERKKKYFKTEYEKLLKNKKICDVKDWHAKIKAFHKDGEQAFSYNSIRTANLF